MQKGVIMAIIKEGKCMCGADIEVREKDDGWQYMQSIYTKGNVHRYARCISYNPEKYGLVDFRAALDGRCRLCDNCFQRLYRQLSNVLTDFYSELKFD
jgi:hypothetical protein